jgi:DNA-binding protein HU-beta
MSRAFIAQVLQESTGITQQTAKLAATDLIEAIIKYLRQEGTFSVPSFGTFSIKRTKARIRRNPRTGEPVNVKAGKTIRFKPSPKLRRSV